ncbi:MAG: metallophosphoesterase family protein [Pyrinomonadaceae bacterium]
MPSTPLRFLQISDVHVDSKLTHGKLGWPKDKREERLTEINSLVDRAMELVPKHGIEAVLIPGDLWDDETVSPKSVNRLIEAFASIRPIPVFIAPGNHDFCSPLSMYASETLAARRMRPWPDNVIIFHEPNFFSVSHPLRPDVVVVGRAFLQNVRITERLLGKPVRRPDADIRILLFHGSLDGYMREGPDKITAPFSSEELLSQGFSYAALGHYHQFDQIVDGTGRVRAAYAGSTGGRTLSEDGPRYVLLGSVDSDGLVGDFAKVELDRRRIRVLDVDVSGTDSSEIQSKIEHELEVSGCRPEDIIAIRLNGRVYKGTNTDMEIVFSDRYFHFKLFDRTKPAYDIENYDTRTVEGRFIQKMQQEIVSAETDDKRLLLERALYYGLDALFQGEVKPTYED